MALTLRVTSYQSETLGEDACKVFSGQGGTLGRAVGNDWVLPDPERFLSGRHAAITYEDGAYYLSDTSTNGVYVNESEQPLGKDGRVKLNDGDRLFLGDFNILVSIDATALDDSALPSPATDPDLYAASATGSPGALPTALDPLELLEELEAGKSAPDASTWDQNPLSASPEQHGAERDDVPATDEYFQAPTPVVEPILEDWNMTDMAAAPSEEPAASIVEPVPEHGPKKPARPAPTPEDSKPAPVHWPSGAVTVPSEPPATPAGEPSAPPRAVAESGDERLLQAFLQGAGLDQTTITRESAEELMGLVGQIFRQMVQDLREVLMARADLKSGFRITATMIQPVENNPLKFSAGGIDETMRNLLFPQGPGYLPGTQAVQEGFQDIKNHQLATMAGMQAVFEAMLTRFDPKALQGRVDKSYSEWSLLAAQKKASYWDAYATFFEEVKKQAEDNFQGLFGNEFARAYEKQIRELHGARKKGAD